VTEKISYAPVIEIAGRQMEPAQYEELRTMRIDRQLGLVGRATLRFNDMGYKLASTQTFKINQKLKIKQFPSTELFSGIVVGISLEQMPGEQPQLVVVADDTAYKLTLSSNTKTYLQTTYTTAVQQIVAKAGLKPQIKAHPGTKEYLLQAGSDLDFIDDVAERIGYSWWVDQETFHFAPGGTSTGQVKVTMNDDLQEFSVRASALRPTEVTMGGWSTDKQQKVVGKIKKATVWTKPSEFVKPYVNDAHMIGKAKAGSRMFSPVDQSEAKAQAQAHFDDALAASLIARGRGHVNGMIKPAVMLQVDHAGPASGSYYVTEVQHVYNPSGFQTRFVAGPLRPAGLVDTLGRDAPDPGFAISGLVVGVVTNNSDMGKAGRVKVKYAGLPDDVESNWARVLSTSGGKNRGLVFLPEVDDEVLVGFENNDTRHPVVLGALFSKKNTLPEATKLLGPGNKVDYRRITSRLGHVIEFADGIAPTTQHVLVQLGGSAKQHKLRLGADRFDIELAMGKPLLIKAGMAKFEITASGDINIEGMNINIKGTKAVNIEAPQTTIKGMAQVQVQGGQVQVKGMGMTAVEAGGPLTLKGITVAIN
jgi:phage protein D/phage baseplate assembly protein gpV